MVRTYTNLWLTCCTREQAANTCGPYFYCVSSEYASAHTAFETRGGLLCWLLECGLTLESELPAKTGEFANIRILGTYRTESHIDERDFYALVGLRTLRVDNGDYTLAVITADPDGLRTVHTLNPNVRSRPEFEYRTARAAISMHPANSEPRDWTNAWMKDRD